MTTQINSHERKSLTEDELKTALIMLKQGVRTPLIEKTIGRRPGALSAALVRLYGHKIQETYDMLARGEVTPEWIAKTMIENRDLRNKQRVISRDNNLIKRATNGLCLKQQDLDAIEEVVRRVVKELLS